MMKSRNSRCPGYFGLTEIASCTMKRSVYNIAQTDKQLYHSTPETQTDEAYNHPEGEPTG